MLFFSCDLPTAVEIRGNPHLAFPANIDIGDTVSSKLTEGIAGIEGSSIIPCKNTYYQTYLIYMNLPVDEVSENLEPLKKFDHDVTVTYNNDKILYETEESMDIPLSSLNDFLKGFSLSQVKTKLYIGGIHDALIEIISIQIIIDDIEQESFKIIGNNTGASNLKDLREYTDTEVPDRGHEIDGLTFGGEDKKIRFRALIKKGESFSTYTPSGDSIFENTEISVEIVIWLPIVLEAGPDGGALTFPDDLFEDGKDIFGRYSAASENMMTDFVQSLELSAKLNSDLFDDSKLIISSVVEYPPEEIEDETEDETGDEIIDVIRDEIIIVNHFKGNSLNLAVSEENIQRINNHFPFSPKLRVEFEPGKVLAFPWNLSVNEIALKAKIRHRIDL